MLETIITTIAVVLILFALVMGVNIMSLLGQKIREMQALRADHAKLIERYTSLVRNFDELTTQYVNTNKKIASSLSVLINKAEERNRNLDNLLNKENNNK